MFITAIDNGQVSYYLINIRQGETAMNTIINSGEITSYKSRDAAVSIAATFADDPEMKAVVIERKDGRFVIEIRDEHGNRVMVL
jgi:hypothetical protein